MESTLPAPPESDLVAKIGRLEARASELEAQLRAAHDRHDADVHLIGTRLLELAEEHGWCDTFDREVSELNRRLSVELPTREREYRITYTVVAAVTATSSDIDTLVRDIQCDLENVDLIYDVTHYETEEE